MRSSKLLSESRKVKTGRVRPDGRCTPANESAAKAMDMEQPSEWHARPAVSVARNAHLLNGEIRAGRRRSAWLSTGEKKDDQAVVFAGQNQFVLAGQIPKVCPHRTTLCRLILLASFCRRRRRDRHRSGGCFGNWRAISLSASALPSSVNLRSFPDHCGGTRLGIRAQRWLDIPDASTVAKNRSVENEPGLFCRIAQLDQPA